MEEFGVPTFHPMQDSRSYFEYHHTAADTFDKVDPHQLQENAAVVAVTAYGLANSNSRCHADTRQRSARFVSRMSKI